MGILVIYFSHHKSHFIWNSLIVLPLGLYSRLDLDLIKALLFKYKANSRFMLRQCENSIELYRMSSLKEHASVWNY